MSGFSQPHQITAQGIEFVHSHKVIHRDAWRKLIETCSGHSHEGIPCVFPSWNPPSTLATCSGTQQGFGFWALFWVWLSPRHLFFLDFPGKGRQGRERANLSLGGSGKIPATSRCLFPTSTKDWIHLICSGVSNFRGYQTQQLCLGSQRRGLCRCHYGPLENVHLETIAFFSYNFTILGYFWSIEIFRYQNLL